MEPVSVYLTQWIPLGYTLDIMNATTIHIKTDMQTKIKAKKVAEQFGLTLTSMVNALLKEITRTKKLYLSLGEEEPTEYFKQLMRQADEDIKEGRVISFKDGKEAINHVNSLIKNDKRKTESSN